MSRVSRAGSLLLACLTASVVALAQGGSSRSAAWVARKPGPKTQVQKSAEERGINPCNTPDPGFGDYAPWSRAPSLGQMLAPKRGGITKGGRFDLLVHFHGHEAVRKEWVQVMDGAVLVGIDLGVGSGAYASAFALPERFEQLIDSVERAMAERTGHPKAHVGKLGLSAWSAGYGAVGAILQHGKGRGRVDTVILLDGLHSGYVGERLNHLQLRPFTAFAERAAERQKLMFVSHSSIIPPGYASTTETANFLIATLGGKPQRARPRAGDPMGLDLIARYSRGHFHVRGYAGNAKLDHCAHIGLFRDVLGVHVKPRWRSPKARR